MTRHFSVDVKHITRCLDRYINKEFVDKGTDNLKRRSSVVWLVNIYVFTVRQTFTCM